MTQVTLYHNPRCSKSRAALKLLEEQQVDLNIIEYLKHPLTEQQLKQLSQQLGDQASNIVRKKESLYQELDLETASNAQLLKTIADNPSLMERPIAQRNNKAVIGRPPENVLALIEG